MGENEPLIPDHMVEEIMAPKPPKPEAGSAADLARFYEKVKNSEEEALTLKHLEWGWKNLGPDDGAALAHVIKNNKKCITLECARLLPPRLPPPTHAHARACSPLRAACSSTSSLWTRASKRARPWPSTAC